MKSRSVIIIVITLIIGFVLGMLTSAQLRYQKLKPVRVFFSEERFREGFYKTIQPTEEQKAVIEEILDRYAVEMSDLQNQFRKSFETKMKAFRKEIDSKLTKEQQARLKEMDEKRDQMIRESHKKWENDTTNRRYRDRHDDEHYRNEPSQKSGTDSASRPQ
ncbi:MAG TPA: hypothetical protein VHO46_13755 [Bacteroidales bacterium]|nr:hypothetical protein [Bacteroidales bacterium]